MRVKVNTAFFADPVCKQHLTPAGHPERPARFDAALRGLSEWQLWSFEPRRASENEVALCHSREYITLAELEAAAGHSCLSTGDTDISPLSYEVALRAAGTVLSAVDVVIEGGAGNAFCVVRPPGHHATPDGGMGFCLFNNIAIGARYAQQRYGIERVLIADWDVHHGNGTQDIFYEDGSVFFFSTHQYPWYPGTGAANERGEGQGEGTTLNCPFPEGSGRKEILGAFEAHLAPAAAEFKPDLVMISAGFDSRIGDPLGGFTLNDEDFSELTGVMMEIADTYANGRLVSILEGGYQLDGLTRAVRAHAGRLEAF